MIRCMLVIASLIPSIACAASFDCDKAGLPLEKAVCADPALSALDSSIAQSYNTAMQRLSGEGRTVLRDGQRQWLHFVRDLCIAPPDANEVGLCLTRQYTERLKELSTAAVSIGPFLLSRSDYFSANTHDETGRPYKVHTAAPRIDAPLSPLTALWNSAMANQAKRAIGSSCDSQHGDEYFGFEVTYASARAISVRTTDGEYCHGTAHGHGGNAGVTYIIESPIRSLAATDLFDMNTEWGDFLTRRSYEVIKEKAEDMKVDRDQVQDAATDIRNWTLTRDGLLITFDPYVVLGYAAGTTEVTIPWSDLKPFFAPNAPVPPPT